MLGIVKVDSSGVCLIGVGALVYKCRPSAYLSTAVADLLLIFRAPSRDRFEFDVGLLQIAS